MQTEQDIDDLEDGEIEDDDDDTDLVISKKIKKKK